MSADNAATSPLDNLREALDKIAEASRVLIVHPDHEAAARTAIAETTFPGLFDVTVSKECPRDRVFLIPKPERIPPGSPEQ